MIKERMTPLLKKRFLDELTISKEKGVERGFWMCIDDKDKIIPSKPCEGDSCSIGMNDPRYICPNGNTQGDFHTHPYISEAEKELKNRGIEVDREVFINRMKNNIRKFHENAGVKDITINSPTYDDLLSAIVGKCANYTRGTVCTMSDIGDNRVECWTLKDMQKDKRDIYCAKAYSERRKREEEEGGIIEEWTDRIFDRETIEL